MATALSREINDVGKRKAMLSNALIGFGEEMVGFHEAEQDRNAMMNNTVCLTRDHLITSVQHSINKENMNYGVNYTVPSPEQNYYSNQNQSNYPIMMAPQPIKTESDNFNISEYIGAAPAEKPVVKQSSLEEDLKPIIVRLEGICKILGMIYQELKKPASPVQEVSTPSEEVKPVQSVKSDEEYPSLDNISDEDVKKFEDGDSGNVEYV